MTLLCLYLYFIGYVPSSCFLVDLRRPQWFKVMVTILWPLTFVVALLSATHDYLFGDTEQ